MYRFDGNETHSPITISLSVRMDPHNAILARPWLYMMKDVPSTYHQIVRYPTLTGTADIRGDQAGARTILSVAQKRSGWKPKTARAVPEEIFLEKKLILVATE